MALIVQPAPKYPQRFILAVMKFKKAFEERRLYNDQTTSCICGILCDGAPHWIHPVHGTGSLYQIKLGEKIISETEYSVIEFSMLERAFESKKIMYKPRRHLLADIERD